MDFLNKLKFLIKSKNSKSFFETVKNRRSTKSYKIKEIDEKLINQILDSARRAPSAMNTQPWRFYVAKSSKAKKKVMKAMKDFNNWAEDASALIVVIADMNTANKVEENKYFIDIGLCSENLMLAAEALGLGTCACTGFFPQILDKELGLAENLKSIMVIPVGYEKKRRKMKEKLSLNEVKIKIE